MKYEPCPQQLPQETLTSSTLETIGERTDFSTIQIVTEWDCVEEGVGFLESIIQSIINFNLVDLQNLVILAFMVFIFIGEQLFSRFTENERKSKFTKAIVLNEIIDIKKSTIVGIIAIVLFALLNKIHFIGKLFLLLITFVGSYQYIYKPVMKFNHFFGEKRINIEAAFLKKLENKELTKKNPLVRKPLVKNIWFDVWAFGSDYERDQVFTPIFQKQLNTLFKLSIKQNGEISTEKFFRVIILNLSYLDSIKKRHEIHSLSEMLLTFLKLNEKSWRYNFEEKQQKYYFQNNAIKRIVEHMESVTYGPRNILLTLKKYLIEYNPPKNKKEEETYLMNTLKHMPKNILPKEKKEFHKDKIFLILEENLIKPD